MKIRFFYSIFLVGLLLLSIGFFVENVKSDDIIIDTDCQNNGNYIVNETITYGQSIITSVEELGTLFNMTSLGLNMSYVGDILDINLNIVLTDMDYIMNIKTFQYEKEWFQNNVINGEIPEYVIFPFDMEITVPIAYPVAFYFEIILDPEWLEEGFLYIEYNNSDCYDGMSFQFNLDTQVITSYETEDIIFDAYGNYLFNESITVYENAVNSTITTDYYYDIDVGTLFWVNSTGNESSCIDEYWVNWTDDNTTGQVYVNSSGNTTNVTVNEDNWINQMGFSFDESSIVFIVWILVAVFIFGSKSKFTRLILDIVLITISLLIMNNYTNFTNTVFLVGSVGITVVVIIDYFKNIL